MSVKSQNTTLGEIAEIKIPKFNQSTYLKKGDILFRTLASKPGQMGPTEIVKSSKNYSKLGAYTIIRVKSKILNPKFLLINLYSQKIQNYLNRVAQGTIIKRVRRNDLSKLTIPIFNKKDQQKIIKKYEKKHSEILKLEKHLEQKREQLKKFSIG